MCIAFITTTVIDMISVVFFFALTKKNTDFMSEDKHLDFKQKHK